MERIILFNKAEVKYLEKLLLLIVSGFSSSQVQWFERS